MLIRLHKNATTTPTIRAYIQSSAKTAAELARKLGVSQGTNRRWKSRNKKASRSALQRALPPRSFAPAHRAQGGEGLQAISGLRAWLRAYRAPANPAETTANQRNGRALQGRISEILATHPFNRTEALETTLRLAV